MKIDSLQSINQEKLYEAFDKAFADYGHSWNKQEFFKMLKRRGFNAIASFGAFDNDELVSFTFNGIGRFKGIRTAYDTETGTLKDYQGKGLASQIFNYAIPHLKETGIEYYLLEVLQDNKAALNVYLKLGFEVTREFYFYKTDRSQIKNDIKIIDSSYTTCKIALNQLGDISDFWDFEPSWQNSTESIQRDTANFTYWTVFHHEAIIGYAAFDASSGDIAQLAVSKVHRRKGIGSLLLQKLIDSNQLNTLKVLNVEIGCHPMNAFLKSKGFEPLGKQFEMMKKLE